MIEIFNYNTDKKVLVVSVGSPIATMDVKIVAWGIVLSGVEEWDDGYKHWFALPFKYLYLPVYFNTESSRVKFLKKVRTAVKNMKEGVKPQANYGSRKKYLDVKIAFKKGEVK